MTRREYVDKGLYLPRFMRDFHDQKDIFKSINDVVRRAMAQDKHSIGGVVLSGYNWVLHHILTIDFFLWFFAQHGYTLQRTRLKVDDGFCDLDASVKDGIERWRNSEGREVLAGELPEASEGFHPLPWIADGRCLVDANGETVAVCPNEAVAAMAADRIRLQPHEELPGSRDSIMDACRNVVILRKRRDNALAASGYHRHNPEVMRLDREVDTAYDEMERLTGMGPGHD